jgi:RNA polymerase sigma-70 factor (ECF subfamily)
MRNHADIEQVIRQHSDTVWRVCLLYFGQHTDAQDAFQETFIKYAMQKQEFNGQEHIKAWLIRVAANTCKDMLRHAHRKDQQLDASISAPVAPSGTMGEAVTAILAMDDPPRSAVYLSLYEGYSAPEIAGLLDVPVGTVYSWVSRGKKHLREVLK